MSLDITLALSRGSFMLRCALSLPTAAVCAIHGPSGSGKTSLLRAIAGLELGARGRIVVDGESWLDSARGIQLPAWRRAVGYVFQEPSLLSHCDVAQNILFGAGRGSDLRSPGIAEVIHLLGLQPLLDRSPDALSGGEQQRVAIARALAARPRLLLLDEPLSALDPARRREVLPWLATLRRELKLPMLYVTHQTSEVMQLADHLVLIENGEVRASDRLEALLPALQPRGGETDAEACALLHGQVLGHDPDWKLTEVDCDGLRLWLCTETPVPLGRALRLRIEARDVSLSLDRPLNTSIQNLIECHIQAVAAAAHPAQRLVSLQCGRQSLLARVTARAAHELGLAQGGKVWAQVKAVAVLD